MAEIDADETHEATPHRRQKAREQGHVARSHDLAQAAVLLAGLGGLLFAGRQLAAYFGRLARGQLGGEAHLAVDAPQIVAEWQSLLGSLAQAILPLLATLLAVSVLGHLLQGGFHFLPQRLAPDVSRISPLAGLRRMASPAALIRWLLGMGKVAVIGLVAGVCLWQARDRLLALPGLPVSHLAAEYTDVLLWTALKVAAALGVLAVVDYGWQWWRHQQDLRMSPQEVRQEQREEQGDPGLLSRRRRVQQERLRVTAGIRTAHVVVTSPTGLAVALRYDAATMPAPLLVEKANGTAAARIIERARRQGIPIVDHRRLAVAISSGARINRPIPAAFYADVAELLADVQRRADRSYAAA
jgi:flagellar biosynthetic protein FlhB